ncbi:MAG: hypothetical protein JNM68_12920 [Dinghuibacter sp.]|nr:hypothetical protein [Dinghuibacter sp.]
MKINGTIFEVTNLPQFATSFILNPNNPQSNTFKAAPNIRVHLSSAIPGFGGFFPGLSLNVHSASDGKFSFNVSAAQLAQLKLNKLAYFVAYRKTGSVNILGNEITIFEPVYRSATFDITKLGFSKAIKLFFAPQSVPNESGITQAQVDAQVKAAKKDFKDIEKLSATIQTGKVSVKGSGRGADIKFAIDLGVSTSFDLNRFITGKLKDLDIDLPGPDFITGICVSKDDIEKQIEKAISNIVKDSNKTIKDTLVNELAAQTGQSKAVIKTLLDSTASITFSKLSFPVTGHKTITVPIVNQTIKIDILSVVPKLSIGFPRNIG